MPAGTLVGAGIGCHTMALLMDGERVGDIGGLGCMGTEGTQWIGMSPFLDRKHFIQNLGDGTFFHSGQLAVQASVAAGVNVTYKLLYNGTVAMTGGQDPPSQLEVPAIARIFLEQGVARVLITTDDVKKYKDERLPLTVEVWSRERLIEAQEMLSSVPGTTVLIHDQVCAAEARRARKRGKIETPLDRVVINHRICEGCGDCGQVSNCLSVQPVETPFGRKTEINQTTCNLDYSCLEGDCPSFMTVTRREPSWLGRILGQAKNDEVSDVASGESAAPSPVLPEPPGTFPAPELIVPADDFAMRITGIGGTGIVTAAQILGTAAMIDGFHVRGLDQIGLSQKAGPVVSDLRLSRVAPTATNRLGEGQADLLLAIDQIVAASERGLRTTDPQRTVVVGSTTATPTGEMITHLDLRLPAPSVLSERIAEHTRPLAQFWADAEAITEDLFGSTTTANLFVVGMAVQAGCLPVQAETVEAAIALNGISVEANCAAFRWGRAQVAMPDRVEAARKLRQPAIAAGLGRTARLGIEELPAGLGRRIKSMRLAASAELMVVRFTTELLAWGQAADAAAYLDLLERVATSEREIDGASSRLFEVVAAQYYKLIAYKDEYEVARLMTDEGGLSALEGVPTEGGRIAWRLHPPILKALGLRRKIKVGLWAAPFVRLLAKGKWLRGTRLDPFRWAEVRKLEAVLAGEYRSLIEGGLVRANAKNLTALCEIAALPDSIRGYEDLKVERIASYRAKLADDWAAFESEADSIRLG